MRRVISGLILAYSSGCIVTAFEAPAGLLDRFLGRTRTELGRLPDFACSETVERFSRASRERSWEKTDSIRFEVALVGGRELYARPGEREFQSRHLSEIAGRGTIGSGQFANLAKHVFLTSTAHFTYRAETEENGRRAYEYEYDVPPADSSYRLRSGTAESTVGFQGSFWIDADTADLIRLDVQAYDIPDQLGLAEATSSVSYSRVTIDGAEILLPLSAKLSVVAADGVEHLNRTRLDGCRHYRADSTIRFENQSGVSGAGAEKTGQDDRQSARTSLPVGILLELTLEAGLNPATASVGDAVRAAVSRAIKDGEKVLIPQGATAAGHVVRLEKQTRPFPIYEVGFAFSSLEIGDRSVPLAATMEDAGPAAGLIRQSKRLDPTFTRRRTARMDILVHEVQRGQGILNWDARRGPIPHGLKMRWRVDREPGDEATRVRAVRDQP